MTHIWQEMPEDQDVTVMVLGMVLLQSLTRRCFYGYDDIYFVELLGKTDDQLWSEYKAKKRKKQGINYFCLIINLCMLYSLHCP